MQESDASSVLRRTSALRRSQKFDTWCLGLDPLDQVRPPLWRLEGLGKVARVAPHLAVFELEDGHTLHGPPPTIVHHALDHPRPLPDQHPPYLDARRGRVL